MLRMNKGNHPVFIGPGILHKQKLCTSYKTLPLLMSKYRVGTNGILVYGTDGEENMAKAFSDAYPDAKHLLCDIHMRDNVNRKLKQLGITGEVASEIVFDIFGKKVDGGIDGGLVDCTSAEEFESALKEITKKWITIHGKGAHFVEYFLKEKASVIRESARADLSEEFSFLKVEEQKFYAMTDFQKKSVRKKFFSTNLTETPTAPRQQPETQHLSISPEHAQIIDIPFPLLKGMFDKASKLLGTPQNVWTMPTSNSRQVFMVPSTSSENPHKVTVFPETGKVSCDKACVNWGTYSLCPHTPWP